MKQIVHLEQELATGLNEKGEPIDSKMSGCVSVFVNSPSGDGLLYTPYEKLRVLILYLLNKMSKFISSFLLLFDSQHLNQRRFPECLNPR